MKNKFILYVIALLLLCNAIFQLTQGAKIDAVGTEAKDGVRRISSELSSFRRSQTKVDDSQDAIITQLRSDIASARADNRKLSAQLEGRLKSIERKLAPPPKK